MYLLVDDGNQNVYAAVLDCQKLIAATLLRVTEDKTTLFSFDWDKFCQTTRMVFYATMAIQCADSLTYRITKKWLAEEANCDIPLQVKYIMNDINSFLDKMMDNNMRETHQKMCQGMYFHLKRSNTNPTISANLYHVQVISFWPNLRTDCVQN